MNQNLNPKVIICVSTYNGEKYIKNQIESLLKQDYKNTEIYVRDDGSKDNTLEILKQYEKDQKIKLIVGKNVGVVRSFYECLEKAYSNGDYFAYCDQDDFWHANKITRAVNMLKNEKNDKPLLYFSEFNYCDEQLNFLNKSKLNRRGADFKNSLVECIAFGISEVFNKQLAKKILDSGTENVCFHDWWAYMIASGMGKVIYDNEATVEYRRTGANVSPSGKSAIGLQIYRIKKFVFGKYFCNIRRQIEKYKELFKNDINKESQQILSMFSVNYNFIKSIKKTFYPKMFRQKISDEIMCRMLFLLGRL